MTTWALTGEGLVLATGLRLLVVALRQGDQPPLNVQVK
jgi:hypothetical protein